MAWYSIAGLILSGIVILSAIAGVFFASVKNRYAKTTSDNYEKTIQSYKDVVAGQDSKISAQSTEIKELRGMHSESMKLIGQLQGELKSYKELPLKQLSDNLKTVTQLTILIAAHLKIDGLDKIDVN